MELISPDQARKQQLFFIACFVGIAIVYFSHLGVVPVHGRADECRRALVPMEMVISGDYLTPTINGEIYLNKPPLYSWIVAGSYHLFGNYSSFALRFPVVLSILMFGLLIFSIVKKYTGTAVAGMTSLAYMTNGRTVTLDSMLGLLEHTLALIIYAGFMLIFILGEKKKWILLFVLTYLLAAVGFLIKGLPALAHLGIALLVYFIHARQFRRLLGWQHLTGILLFLAVIAAYYVPYFARNDISPSTLFTKVVSESSKRYYFSGIGDFFSILFDYPLDFIKHFLPWTLLIILLFRKDTLRISRENSFVWYSLLLFLANTPIYWIAALKNPHYLYMLLPLLFVLLFYVYFHKSENGDWRRRTIDIAFGAGLVLALAASAALPFLTITSTISFVWIKSLMLAIGFAVLLFLYHKMPSFRLFIFVGGIILVRLGFNWFVIPDRVGSQQVYPAYASQLTAITGDAPLYIMAEYPAGFYDGISFFVNERRKDILRVNRKVDPNAFYLADDVYLQKYPHEVFLKFPYEYADNHLRFYKDMYLVKFRTAASSKKKDL